MRTDWAALMRHGVLVLGLSPEGFWRLSWREWQMLTGRPAELVLSRSALDDLMQTFPDKINE